MPLSMAREGSPLRLGAITAVGVAVLALAFDRVLLHEVLPRYDLLVPPNSLIGIVVGAFVYYAMRIDVERRKFIRAQLSTISDMNHHIQNALQANFLSYRQQNQMLDEDKNRLAIVEEATNRIEWAVTELLAASLLKSQQSARTPSEPDPATRKTLNGKSYI